MEPKTFISILNLYNNDFRKFKRKLSDKRLSQTERKILQGWIDFRDGEFSKIVAEISPLTTDSEMIRSEKELLLSIAENNRGNPQKAVDGLLKVVNVLKKFNLPRQLFLAYSNLFVAYLNLKDRDGMEKALEFLDGIRNPPIVQKIQILRCKCKYYMFVGNLDQATRYVKELEMRVGEMSEAQRTGLLLDQFVFYLRQDDFEQCEAILQKIKERRKFKLTANYQFMFKLLKFVAHGGSIYLYPKDYKEIPMLFHQVNVLLSLERGDLSAAQEHWKYLRKQSPAIYGKNLVYSGDKCLFSMALARLRQIPATITQSEKNISANQPEGNKEIQIIRLLESFDGVPVSKEEIYLQVYGSPALTKDELSKLTSAVYRIKSKLGLDIVSKKGCYFLRSSPSKKAA